jgi:hypothetical protein
MKQKVNFIYVILACWVLGGMSACTKMDDYKKYTNGKEISYTGKIDSLKLHSGNNRLVLSWYLVADPKITGITIYWNDHRDSVVIPVKRSTGIDTMEYLFKALPEDTYNFQVFTWNNEGNRSVPVYITGKVYGNRYSNSLLNRGMNSAERKADGNTVIEWGPVEETVIGMELTYTTTTGELRKVISPRTATQSILENYKSGSTYQFRTLFRPDSLSIDTFYAATIEKGVKENITAQYLVNFKRPFQYSEWDGSRWGTLKDWITNDAAKTRSNLYGGVDNISSSGSMGFEKWGGETPIVNGKTYQTITLPAGNYQYGFITAGNPVPATIGEDPRYVVVATGNTLPDVEHLQEAIASVSFVGLDAAATHFTLKAPTTVSLGMVINFTTPGNQSFRLQEFQLFRLP